MKTLKSLTAALLIFVSASAFAGDDSKDNRSQIEYVVGTYVDAFNYGKIKNLSAVLDPNVKFTLNVKKAIVSYNKSEMLDYLKVSENIVQNCQANYSLVEANDAQAVVKVTLQYEDFSKINLITLSNTNKGWKITNVSTSFN